MPLESIVVVGNDDIAWIAADMLARAAQSPRVTVHLIRPTGPVSAWSSIAHGATLLPETAGISDAFGRDELALLRAARGNFLIGSVLQGFSTEGPAFLPFGTLGEPSGQIAFHHLLARRRRTDPGLPLSAFVASALSAQTERFAPPPAADTAGQAALDYGLYIDNARHAAAAAEDAVTRGVRVSTGSIARVERAETGHILAVTTDDGARIAGDLFVDCGNWLDGSRPWLDWIPWLPCDRLAGVIRSTTAAPSISMQLFAHAVGWQRQSSLVGAVVDNFAFCDAAPGERPAGAVPFRSGRCVAPWRDNCVAIGDGAVILDPIVDMRLSLAMSAICRLTTLLPATTSHAVEARDYNRRTVAELDNARDFAAAYYCCNGRTGDPFWDRCRAITPPDTLQARLELYRSCGRVPERDDDPFPMSMWIALFDALGIRPSSYDTLVDFLSADAVDSHLARVRNAVLERVGSMPPYPQIAAAIANS